MTLQRRGVLAGVGLTLSGVAGCLDSPDGTTEESTSTDESTPTDEEAPATGTTAGGTDDLDLREANVTAVELERTDGGYRFSVTLIHDDDGEDGYANWWQVETRQGERLGRRDLAHAHGTREFTRSSTVSVPEELDCVVVRGHDETHGYGGRAMVVAHDIGASRAVDQGSEPNSFEDANCPE
ncbi:MAG: hypothetical protein V5A46_08420 [Haloferacaceae archaeon]